MNTQDLPHEAAPIPFTLDGRAVEAAPGETLLQAAERAGVVLPRLCASEGLRPAGNCRACVVEIQGERVLAPSCCRSPSAGMVVQSDSPRAVNARRSVLELLLADAPDTQRLKHDSELAHWAHESGARVGHFHALRSESSCVRPELLPVGPELLPVGPELLPVRPELLPVRPELLPVRPELVEGLAHTSPGLRQALPEREGQRTPVDNSHPAMSVNRDACIQCTRCIRACRETQGNDVLGLAFRGGHAQIVFDQNDPLGQSTCVACGECVQACPTGAIAPANGAFAKASFKQVDSVCPFCGVGCQLRYHVDENDRIAHVEGLPGPANEGRLCVKGRFGFDYAHSPERLTTPLIRRADAPKDPSAIARRPNPEEVRALFREATWDEALEFAAAGFKAALAATPARGRASPVAGFGSAKGTNEEAYLFQKLVRTAFATHNVDHCTRLCHASSVAALMEGLGSAVVSNPLRDVAHADLVLLIGANPAQNHPVGATWIKNAIRQGTRLVLADPRRTELARQAWRHLGFTAGSDVALLNAMLQVIVSEGLTDPAYIAAHTQDFAAIEAHVAAFTPEAMAPVCGIEPEAIREVARAFATAKNAMILWGMGVSQHAHGTENARALIALSLITGQIGRPGTGLHPLRGQNNVQGASDAGLIPMVLPATAWPEKTGSVTNTDRCVQLGRKAVASPGDARADAWITEQLAVRLGLGWRYSVAPDGSGTAEAGQGIGAVYEEMRALMPSIQGLPWARLWREGAVTYPVSDQNDPGQAVVFTQGFPMPEGRARLVPASLVPPAERPDALYPLVLITGRQLEHWHTGSMTRRSSVLDAIEPSPTVSLHASTAARLGLRAGALACVSSRRGRVTLSVRIDDGMPPDTAFIPFAYAEAAANLLTNPALDPLGKIAELKYCAVDVRPAAAEVASS